MSNTLLNILPGTMPVDCYPASADAFQKQVLALARAVFTGTLGGVAIGQTPPADHDIPWVRTDASNNLIRVYTFGGYGNWVSPHLVTPSSEQRFIWVGLESDLTTYDEGTSDPVTDTTGPFWVVDHLLDGRFPIGSTEGATYPLPSGIVIGPGDTGGEEKHTMTEQELVPHTHDIVPKEPISDYWSGNETGAGKITTGDQAIIEGEEPIRDNAPFFTAEEAGGDADGDAVPFNVMPPYYGVFFIKRTARKYYVV